MLRRLLALSFLAPVAALASVLAAHADPPAEFDIRGLRAGMPFSSVPKSLQCWRIGGTSIAECLPEAGATLKVELVASPAGDRIANVTYYFYSREPLGRDTKVGAALIAKYGEPTETVDGWTWRRGSSSVTATVPGEMQQASLRLEDPDFQRKAEQAEKPPETKPAKPAKTPRR